MRLALLGLGVALVGCYHPEAHVTGEYVPNAAPETPPSPLPTEEAPAEQASDAGSASVPVASDAGAHPGTTSAPRAPAAIPERHGPAPGSEPI